jgi:RND family efflux transporter MFP subunit
LIELDGRDLTAGARSAAAAAAETRDGAAAAEADVRTADAALALARATHGRIASLHAKGSATAQELDESTAALTAGEARAAAAGARARQAQAAIERATTASEAATATAAFLRVTAPFDGLVTETLVEPGNMATPGLPLVRIEDPTAYRLKVRFDESRLGQVRAGAPIGVQLDGPDGQPTEVAGTVVEVSRAVDAGSRSFLVEIDLPGAPGLRAGAFGRARIPGAARRALSVPAEALVRQGQVTSVFVVDGQVVRLRLVRVAGTEVLAGLTAGESVVLAPPPDLTDGRSIARGAR